MADNKIQGRAKKHDGTAIDYVSIFDWNDGKCIAQVIPDASGNWQYSYNKDLKVGITYVTDGCEPITHGAYDFLYEYNPLLDAILHYDFNGNVLDQSANALNGIKTGVANFVAGRKVGTQALEFIAGCVRTPQVLPINSDKMTVSFWISTSQNNFGVIYESSTNYNDHAKATSLFINDLASGFVNAGTRDAPLVDYYNIVKSSISTDNSWQHVVVECDRSRTGDQEYRIYINNTLTSEYVSPYTFNGSGNLVNYIFYVGQRNASSAPFAGKLQDMRIYNRTLTSEERLVLFNE